MSCIKRIFSTLFPLLLIPAYGQVPTIDVAAIAQIIEQIRLGQQQIQQLQNIENTLKGDRGLWNYLNGAEQQGLRNRLPSDLAVALQGGGVLSSDTERLLLGTNPKGTGSAMALEHQRRTAAAEASASAGYGVASTRAANLQALLQRAQDPSIDAKGLDELRLRIQVENGFIAADANRLAALKLAKEARDADLASRKRAQFFDELSGPAQRTK